MLMQEELLVLALRKQALQRLELDSYVFHAMRVEEEDLQSGRNDD